MQFYAQNTLISDSLIRQYGDKKSGRLHLTHIKADDSRKLMQKELTTESEKPEVKYVSTYLLSG